MSAQLQTSPLSFTELLEMEEQSPVRHEYIGGRLYAMGAAHPHTPTLELIWRPRFKGVCAANRVAARPMISAFALRKPRPIGITRTFSSSARRIAFIQSIKTLCSIRARFSRYCRPRPKPSTGRRNLMNTNSFPSCAIIFWLTRRGFESNISRFCKAAIGFCGFITLSTRNCTWNILKSAFR